ncbi:MULTISPECIES: GNAT family N-acetyltransferase [Streptomyces]|uniref:GNAT family acetyltransferase n=1 Tax=Streptomyces alboflavus TaxID=67267 RepID=A0A1Z1WC28_9ACTN|nr:GNAT family N-acetyltransferase [Streptomyces alboflavus]ARX83985.1 GNAT family acetyltransferase [Streptomyces alboflavus]
MTDLIDPSGPKARTDPTACTTPTTGVTALSEPALPEPALSEPAPPRPLPHVTDADADAWHRVVAASMTHDLPGALPPGPEQIRARLTKPALDSHRLTWLAAGPDGVPVGVAGLRLFGSAGRDHLAELELHVDPAHRRLGTGSRLLAAAVAACRAEGRRSLITEAAADGPGQAFAEQRGFRGALTLDHLLLRLDEVAPADLAKAADAEHPGYRLTGWTGAVPDGLAAAFAAAKNAMNDMPMGDLDYGSVAWDADRVRAMAKVVADRGDTLLTIAAVHDDGTMAGYTEILIPQGAPPRAQQYDTAVVPGHRGHGLGLWVKAAMVRRLRAEHPGVAEIETDNADDNVHMLAVNHALGFRPYRRTREFQLDVPTS